MPATVPESAAARRIATRRRAYVLSMDLVEMSVRRYGKDGEVPVCPRCSALVSPVDHYCLDCHAPLGLTPSLPFVYIWACTDFLTRIADSAGRGSWPSMIVLVLLVLLGLFLSLVQWVYGDSAYEPWPLLIPLVLMIRMWRQGRPVE